MPPQKNYWNKWLDVTTNQETLPPIYTIALGLMNVLKVSTGLEQRIKNQVINITHYYTPNNLISANKAKIIILDENSSQTAIHTLKQLHGAALPLIFIIGTYPNGLIIQNPELIITHGTTEELITCLHNIDLVYNLKLEFINTGNVILNNQQ